VNELFASPWDKEDSGVTIRINPGESTFTSLWSRNFPGIPAFNSLRISTDFSVWQLKTLRVTGFISAEKTAPFSLEA